MPSWMERRRKRSGCDEGKKMTVIRHDGEADQINVTARTRALSARARASAAREARCFRAAVARAQAESAFVHAFDDTRFVSLIF